MKNKSAHILLIYTGGTIGMMQDFKSGHLKSFDFKHLSDQIPELEKLDAQLSSVSFEKPIDSSNMQPENWVQIAKIIEKNYSKFDGFVILHGSDTMSFTASALSFMLENLAKPVILTGSQLPIGTIRTDGKENLITAIELASAKQNGKPIITEVCIYFEFQLYRGNRTHKFNSEDFEAFRSPNYPVLANAGVHIQYNFSALLKPNGKPFKVNTQLDNRILILTLFPGISIEVIKNSLHQKNVKAIILETFGAGNASTEKKFLNELKHAIESGKIILNISQCASGSVIQGKYETSTYLAKIGVISGKDMTIETAITKLMFLLGKNKSNQDSKKELQKNLRGEITV
ncbi:MAG TPA: type I asparaginase [Bacteroidia bacterium]|nr:type I asparaginase [Bacteroidia bacterium]